MSHLPVTITRKNVNGELIPMTPLDKIRETIFLETLRDGEMVEITYEIKTVDHSYGQLSKIHVCCREIAKETGASLTEIKQEVKKKAGLVLSNGELKSFADCSRDELAEAIKSVVEIGSFVNVNCNNY